MNKKLKNINYNKKLPAVFAGLFVVGLLLFFQYNQILMFLVFFYIVFLGSCIFLFSLVFYIKNNKILFLFISKNILLIICFLFPLYVFFLA